MNIEFWFDFASTYSYPTAMRIEHLVAQKNLKIIWRPFLLGVIFNKQGWNDSPFNIYPAKGEYMWKDLMRVCRDLEIPFNRPTIFPRNGLLAARVATRFSESPWVPSFIRSVFSANFEHDQEISSPDIISSCLDCSVKSVDSILKEAHSPESKDMLREQTDEAYKRGIFGAPSFYVGNELFWGNDRLESAIKWAAGE